MITLIANVQQSNLGIGYKGKLLHPSRRDFNFFKLYTYGKTVIVGERTFLGDLKGKPLVGRETLVVDRSFNFNPRDYNDKEYVVIGGGYMYQLFFPFASKLVITETEGEKEADTFFPEYRDASQWTHVGGVYDSYQTLYSAYFRECPISG